MPNTLVHIAVQVVATRPRHPDSRYLSLGLLGCVIPDVPWILQRLLQTLPVDIDPYSLRAYATVQASLFVSMILAGACSLLFYRAFNALMIVTMGCILHLFLDASEIKWGNGVNLFAPFEWSLVSWGVIWPEHPLITAASIAGLAVFVIYAVRSHSDSPGFATGGPRVVGSLIILIAYFIVPLLFIDAPYRSDSHNLSTLTQFESRPGKTIELDRSTVEVDRGHSYVVTFAGERIRLTNFSAESRGTYSLQGRFVSESSIQVSAWRRHGNLRDPASIAGLTLVLAWFGVVAARSAFGQNSLRRDERQRTK